MYSNIPQREHICSLGSEVAGCFCVCVQHLQHCTASKERQSVTLVMLSGSTRLFTSSSAPSSFPSQILIELETALLDDIPHWYKLQTHDASSIPLPQPSPYLPRRHVHADSPSKKLQSMSGYTPYMSRLCAYIYIYRDIYIYQEVFSFVNLLYFECVVANLCFTELSLFVSQWNRTAQPYPVLYVCVC